MHEQRRGVMKQAKSITAGKSLKRAKREFADRIALFARIRGNNRRSCNGDLNTARE